MVLPLGNGTWRSTQRNAVPCRSGSRLRSQSLRIVDVHGRPNRVGDLLEHRRSELNCGSQTLKTCENLGRLARGSGPPPMVGLRQDGMQHELQRARSSSVVTRQQKASRPPARRIAGSPPPPSSRMVEQRRTAKIRPYPGRRTSSRVGTQQDTMRRNNQVTGDPLTDHRRPVH